MSISLGDGYKAITQGKCTSVELGVGVLNMAIDTSLIWQYAQVMQFHMEVHRMNLRVETFLHSLKEMKVLTDIAE